MWQIFVQFSPSLCNNFCFLILPASQTTLQPPVTPSAVATRKPVGEEAGLSSSSGWWSGQALQQVSTCRTQQRLSRSLLFVWQVLARLFAGDGTSCTLTLCAETSSAWSDTSANSSARERSFSRGTVWLCHGFMATQRIRGHCDPIEVCSLYATKTVAIIDRWEWSCVVWHNWATEDISADWGYLNTLHIKCSYFIWLGLFVYFCKWMQIKR